jgi:sigma-B regulation protein RsbU (phosphoserine phosphatase)
MFPSSTYEVKKVTINNGEMAVLFTDGITESRNKDNKEFDEKGLIKLLRKHPKLKASKILKKINEELNSFTAGADRMDDMTLVIIQRTS